MVLSAGSDLKGSCEADAFHVPSDTGTNSTGMPPHTHDVCKRGQEDDNVGEQKPQKMTKSLYLQADPEYV